MTSTTPSQNKRSEELNETEIAKLLNDVMEKLPSEAKKLIMLAVIELATSQESQLVSYLKDLIGDDNQSDPNLDTFTGSMTTEHIKKAKEIMDLNDLASRG